MNRGGGPPNARTGDPAAQPERTRFAWRRTTLTFAVALALAVRQALYGSGGGASAAEAGAVAVGALSWVSFLVLAHRRIADMRADRPVDTGAGTVLAAALCTLAMATVGMVLLW